MPLEKKAWELCGKSAAARKTMYKKKAVKRQRADACGDKGKHPRCVGNGMYVCAKNPTRKAKPKAKATSQKTLKLK